MGDMAEGFREMNKLKKERRQSNTERSTEMLEKYGVDFESKNGGAHLIVKHGGKVIDFWPSTGRFIERGGKGGRGVFNVLKRVRAYQ